MQRTDKMERQPEQPEQLKASAARIGRMAPHAAWHRTRQASCTAPVSELFANVSESPAFGISTSHSPTEIEDGMPSPKRASVNAICPPAFDTFSVAPMLPVRR